MAKKLFSLNAAEISLVPNGANKKKFLILKRGTDQLKRLPQDILDALKKDPKGWEHVKKTLDGMKKSGGMNPSEQPGDPQGGQDTLSPRAEAAVKAIVRILAPFKDELSPLVLHEVLDSAGWKLHETQEHGQVDESNADANKSADQKGEHMDEVAMSVEKHDEVPMEHHMEAMTHAKKAYAEHLKKLGAPKYPAKPSELDSTNTGLKKHGDETEEEEEEQEHEKKEGVMKNGALDLSKVAPELRSVLSMIYKSNQELVKKNADLRLELEDVKKAGQTKELVQKVSAFSHYEGDKTELVNELLALQSNPKAYEIVMKQLQNAERAHRGSQGLFSEMGSPLPDGVTEFTGAGTGSGAESSSWDKIEKMAASVVQKSATPMTQEQAMDKVLSSPEGKHLYRIYKGSRKAGA